MLTIPENGKKYETDVTSVGGYKMSIYTDPHGYYRIAVDGKGQPPAVCKEMFTSLKAARHALQKYVIDNAATLSKKEIIRKHGKSDSE